MMWSLPIPGGLAPRALRGGAGNSQTAGRLTRSGEIGNPSLPDQSLDEVGRRAKGGPAQH